jgi:hypothetical protein
MYTHLPCPPPYLHVVIYMRQLTHSSFVITDMCECHEDAICHQCA